MRQEYSRLPPWLCRLIASGVPVVVAGLTAAALTVVAGFGSRPEVFDEGLLTAGWIGGACACCGAAAVVIALRPRRKSTAWEAVVWFFAAVPLFTIAYIALASVAMIAGHIYFRGFD